MLEVRSNKILLFKIRSELLSAYVNQISMIFSNILMIFNYALRTSNRKKNLKIFVKKSEKECPKSLETLGNGVLKWRANGLRSSSNERRGMMESNNNQHSFTLDIPA